MKGAEYEYERLANSVFVLGIVSSGSAVDRENNLKPSTHASIHNCLASTSL